MSTTDKKEPKQLQKLSFDAIAPTIERTHTHTGKVLYAEDYVAKGKDGDIAGVAMQVEGIPYPVRILKGSLKGAGNAATVLGCTITFTGVMREYNQRQYFNAKDAKVDKQSGLAKIAAAGVAFAGSLD